VDTEQLLDGGEILTCTFATMDVLQRAVAAELGEDDGESYGLAPRPDLRVLTTEDGSPAPPE
jgi:hypothetical protein